MVSKQSDVGPHSCAARHLQRKLRSTMESEPAQDSRLPICKADQCAGSGPHNDAARYRHCGVLAMPLVGNGGGADLILEVVNEVNDLEKGPTWQRLSHNVCRVVHSRDMLERKHLA